MQLLHEGRLQLRRVRQRSVQQFKLVMQQWRLGLWLREYPLKIPFVIIVSVLTLKTGISQVCEGSGIEY